MNLIMYQNKYIYKTKIIIFIFMFLILSKALLYESKIKKFQFKK